jgi:hypothetical protein
MSNTQYPDPQFDPPPQSPRRVRKLGQMESTNAMWGWIAGGVVLVLLLLFIFARNSDNSGVAKLDNANQPSTSAAAPPRQPPAPANNAQAPQPAPSTTGQGNPQR